jgi:hypothetical protein
MSYPALDLQNESTMLGIILSTVDRQAAAAEAFAHWRTDNGPTV